MGTLFKYFHIDMLLQILQTNYKKCGYKKVNCKLLMAELNVQPKRKTPWWLWLILLLIALCFLFFFMRGCGNEANLREPVITDTVSSE